MITKYEYLKLKERYKKGYRWIARDKDGSLYMYYREPKRLVFSWMASDRTGFYTYEDDRLFRCIKWEDEKPTKIDDLICDYESHQVIVSESLKVTVPQFVADWIEYVKDMERPIKLELLFYTLSMPVEVREWLIKDDRHTDILAKAWLDGYEVEKEKLYTVRLANGSILIKDPEFNTFQLCKAPKEQIEGYEYKLTQSEIESVDPILMQIAKPIGK